jgi:hypothetical protein
MVDRDLEIVQERHIRKKIREYLKPFRLFLTAIGRFPYTVVDLSARKKLVQAIKKTSCAPIMELGVIQVKILWNFSKINVANRPA